jgi:hypothetical protein
MNGARNGTDFWTSPTVSNPNLQYVSPAGQNTTGLRVVIPHFQQDHLVPNLEEAAKHKSDKLAACKHVIAAQPQALQASIRLFAKKMVSGTHDLYEVEGRLRPFIEWDQTKDPAYPCYLPQNFRFKSSLNFTSKFAQGDEKAEALISKMTEATRSFKQIASDLTLQGHKVDIELMQRQRLETFANGAIKLIDPFVESAKLRGPGKTSTRDNKTFAGILLLKYMREELDDDYLLYLRSTDDEVRQQILKATTTDPDAHASLLNPILTTDEKDIYDTVVKNHLSKFFMAVTSGIQKYLDEERSEKMWAANLKAYTLKKEITEATDAITEAVAEEETLTPNNLTKFIDERIKLSKHFKGDQKAQPAKPKRGGGVIQLVTSHCQSLPLFSKQKKESAHFFCATENVLIAYLLFTGYYHSKICRTVTKLAWPAK